MILIVFFHVFPCVFQALRLFRLAAKLETKAAALKSEALQHLFIALAGSDCKELWTLLVHFFGKGTGFDPFEFLDGAPAITRPLDLTETDSEDEASEAASSVMIGSVSTTASLDADASTSSAPTAAPRPVPKAKHVLPDKFPAVEFADGCIPTSMADIHSTRHTQWSGLQEVGEDHSPRQPVYTSALMQTVGLPPTSATYMVAVRTLDGYTLALLLCAHIAQIKNTTGPVAGRVTCPQNTPPPPGSVPLNKPKLL